MVIHHIAPGITISDVVYEQVSEILDTRFPGVLPELTWEAVTAPAGGAWRIPDPTGAVSKVELILLDTPRTTVKINNWFLPDLRAGERPAPHNHRWRTMRSTIVSGGYRDRVYWADVSGVTEQVRTHDTGGQNTLPHHEFHEVIEVEPGSWTVFVGDDSQPGDWGYLDPGTGRYTHNAAISPDPNFAAAFKALNPSR